MGKVPKLTVRHYTKRNSPRQLITTIAGAALERWRKEAPDVARPKKRHLVDWVLTHFERSAASMVGSCYYSGAKITPAKFEVIHKVPLSRGGTNDFDNLIVVDLHTRRVKGEMTDEELRKLILFLREHFEDKGYSIFYRLRRSHYCNKLNAESR